MTSASPETHHAPSSDTFTVVTWNIFLDKTRTKKGLVEPQSKRLPSQIETLRNLDVDLDVVAIQEAHVTEQQHNGEVLASQLGFEASFWREHNTTKRHGDNTGGFGRLVEDAEFFDLGHDKLGMLTYVGRVAIVAVHLRNEIVGPIRANQTRAVIERLGDEAQAIVMGDLNASPFEEPHQLLQDEDFESAFTINGGRRPKTWPTQAYRDVFYPLGLRQALPSVCYDDIYVRGLDVEWAISFEGDSDHKGLAAKVRTRQH